MNSTADLVNWRQHPEYRRDSESTMNLWDFLRSQSYGSMGVTNTMPNVFEPAKYGPQYPSRNGPADPSVIRDAVMPANRIGLLQLLQGANGSSDTSQLSGILASLLKRG